MRTTRITITRPTFTIRGGDINAELQYLAGSLGLFNPRDKDRSRFRIFVALVQACQHGKTGLSSDDLAGTLGLTRATVIHHLSGLSEGGIIEHAGNRYVLRVESLHRLVHQIRADVAQTLHELEEIARRCDEGLGLR